MTGKLVASPGRVRRWRAHLARLRRCRPQQRLRIEALLRLLLDHLWCACTCLYHLSCWYLPTDAILLPSKAFLSSSHLVHRPPAYVSWLAQLLPPSTRLSASSLLLRKRRTLPENPSLYQSRLPTPALPKLRSPHPVRPPILTDAAPIPSALFLCLVLQLRLEHLEQSFLSSSLGLTTVQVAQPSAKVSSAIAYLPSLSTNLRQLKCSGRDCLHLAHSPPHFRRATFRRSASRTGLALQLPAARSLAMETVSTLRGLLS